MALENERPRPHGDPLRENVEDNPAQRQSDAPGPDANPPAGDRVTDLTGANDRAGGRGSSANGVPAFDEDRGAERRRQYEDNDADLVSGID
jgi:hypothetical protein